MNLIFEWNENKAASNLRKHKISFDEAKTIFNDLLLVTFADDFHSDSKTRFDAELPMLINLFSLSE